MPKAAINLRMDVVIAKMKGYEFSHKALRNGDPINEEQYQEFLNGLDFSIKNFPKPDYILWPILAKQQIRQVFAKAGVGKTLMMLWEACAVASGYGFLHFKNDKRKMTPVLYVEGEMDSSSIQDRLFDIESAYERENKVLMKNKLEWLDD